MVKRNTIILIALLVLALFLRTYQLTEKEMGTDEKWSLIMAEQILEGTFFDKAGTHADQPLFSVFLAPFLLLSGGSLLFLSYLMVLLSLVGIYLAHLLAKRLFSEKVALLTVLLLAFSPLHLIYSHHVRVYVLMIAVALASLLFLLAYLKHQKQKYLFYLFLSYVVLFYLHTLTAFFVLAQYICLFLLDHFKLARLRWKPLLITAGATCVSFLFWLPTFLRQYKFNITDGGIDAIPMMQISYIPYPFYKYAVGIDFSSAFAHNVFALILAAFLGGLFVYALYKLFQTSKMQFIFLSTTLILPIVFMELIGFIFPVFSFRYVSYLIPLFLIVLAKGFTSIKPKYIRITLIALTVIIWFTLLLFYWEQFVLVKWGQHFAI